MAARRRRDFGYVRKMDSGRFQASYLGPDGRRRFADSTFDSRTDADRWLTVTRSALLGGQWADPMAGRETLGRYLEAWIRQRHGLRPRTIDLYEWLNRKHIAPALGRYEVRKLQPDTIRAWQSQLRADGVSNTMSAKAYRLLRAVLNTAVDDGVIQRNPCRIPRGGQENAAERPILTVDQVFDLADHMPARFRAFILVTTFASLRFGEVAALRRRDIDLEAGTVTVRSALVEVRGGSPAFSPPKSRAGYRTIHLPAQIVDEVAVHLHEFTETDASAVVFTGPLGALLRRSGLNKLTKWRETVTELGYGDLHLHDLRHTGNVLAARVPGTSTRDLMQRMGHDSVRAAMIYQHAAQDAGVRIAEGLTVQVSGRTRVYRAGDIAAGSLASLGESNDDA